MQKPKVIVICGPTAVGKSGCAISLAQAIGGEVVSADSRQVYKNVPLSTGIVTAEEMDGIPHHLLSFLDITDHYAVYDFQKAAHACIKEIHDRGNVPIICGGTGLYIESIIDNPQYPPVPENSILRAELESKPAEELFSLLIEKDIAYAQQIDSSNRVRLIRAIEIATALGSVPPIENKPLYDALQIGLTLPRPELADKIKTRLLERIESGMLEEIQTLLDAGVPYERLQELGLEFKYTSQHLKGDLDYDSYITILSTKITQYSKRQMTWFKRNKKIQWFSPAESLRIENASSAFLSA